MRYPIIASLLLLSLSVLFPSCRQQEKKPRYLEQGERQEETGNNGVVSMGVGASYYWKDYAKASDLVNTGRTKEAIALYLELCRKEEAAAKTNAYMGLGLAYSMDGQYPQAVASYKTSIQLDPKNVGSYIGLGTAYSDMNELEQSAAAYKSAIALDANSPDSYWGLAVTYDKMHELNAARRYARRFIELAPDSKYRYVAESILNK